MSQYVFTMTSRMVAITATCLLLLCVLLFLMGLQIGKLLAPPAATAPLMTPPVSAASGPAPAAAQAPTASTQ